MDDEALDFLTQGWNSVLMELKDYCEFKERAAKKRSTIHMAASENTRNC
jgi:fructose-bisphosphate aldolase class 1